MPDLEKLKRVDKDAGVDVLSVWIFDLPELSYMASINVVRQQNEVRILEETKESKERVIALQVEGKSKEIREAEASKVLSQDLNYDLMKAQIRAEYEKLETFKAQREYYDKMFRVVKDELYFRKRMQELDLSRAMKKEAAESFGGEVHRQE